MSNGILIVDKEQGYTSFDVIGKLRKITGQKKMGHTGTLDPDATGVLPVCFGNATKVCELLTESDKEYRAVMLLGVETDTQDVGGTILQEKPVTCNSRMIQDVVDLFVGGYEQVPPMYSALKVNGQKLCDLARKGITIEREKRAIKLYEIEIEEIELPRVTMRISCSKGTYIRTLLHDIGQKLGCGACMERLWRTKAAGFRIEQAIKLSEIEKIVSENRLEDYLITVDSLFPDLDKIIVEADKDIFLYNGNVLSTDMINKWPDTDEVLVYDSKNHFTGIYQKKEDLLKPKKMFLER